MGSHTYKYKNRLVKTTYRDRFDTCTTCGKEGGAHYTTGDNSYCYSHKDRRRYEGEPKYQTSFSYLIIEEDNPNLTFKRRKIDR